MFEFIGAVLSIYASFLLSKVKILPAYRVFAIANIFVLISAIQNNLGALAMLMIAFIFSGSLVLFKKETKIFLKYLFIAYPLIILLITILIIHFLDIPIFFQKEDIIAASLAITGTILLSFQSYFTQKSGFLLFIIADVIYVYLAIKQGMLFFLFQSVFFIFSSVTAITSLSKKPPKPSHKNL